MEKNMALFWKNTWKETWNFKVIQKPKLYGDTRPLVEMREERFEVFWN